MLCASRAAACPCRRPAVAPPRRVAATPRRVAARASASPPPPPPHPDDLPPPAASPVDAEWAALRARLGAAGAGPLSSVDGGDGGGGPPGAWADGAASAPPHWRPSPPAPAASADDTWDWLDENPAGFTPVPPGVGEGGGGPPSLLTGPLADFARGPAPPSLDADAASSSFAAPRAAAPPAASPASWLAHATVHVILFGVGRADTEGIYSLRAARADDGLPHDTIVAFADPDDAARYAGLLEAAMDAGHAPTVCPIDPAELLDFCADAGYDARLEPAGSLLLPPECSVGLTDWERSVRLRAGGWSVLEDEPSVAASASADDAAAPPAAPAPSSPSPFLPPPPFGAVTNNAGAWAGGTIDLDDVRASLERLVAGPDARAAGEGGSESEADE